MKRSCRTETLPSAARGRSSPALDPRSLLATCGGVSFAHGSNDGQKGMGLILLVLIGFLPAYYALDVKHPDSGEDVRDAAISIREILRTRIPGRRRPRFWPILR